MKENPEERSYSTAGKTKVAFLLFSIVALLIVFLMAEAAPTRLVIKRADWNAEKAQLTIEGRAQAGADVLLKDATKDTFLGTVTADSKGAWRFVLAGLPESPTHVAAQSGRAKSERVVRNGSRNGGNGDVGAGKSHADRFTSFEGTKTCLACHKEQALEVHASVHYQWQGDTGDLIDSSTPKAGKLGGINDFCIYPDINWIGKLTNVNGALVDGGCAKCHAGLG